MSDITLNKFLTYGTNADRLAFTPSPPVGVNILYEWYETDTGDTYVYDSAWHLVGSGGSATILVNEVTIADADIKLLPTTPFEIVAAPAAGLIIVPVMIVLQSDFAVAYGVPASVQTYLWAQYGTGGQWSNYLADDSSASVPFAQFTNFFATTTRRRVTLQPWTNTSDAALLWGNLAQTVDLNDAANIELIAGGAGNLTGGDPANSLLARTYYTLVAA